jgi:hypothetical protein
LGAEGGIKPALGPRFGELDMTVGTTITGGVFHPASRLDSSLDVYIVVGHTDVYFDDGWFIRIRSGIW